MKKLDQDRARQFVKQLSPWVSTARLDAHRLSSEDDLATLCTYMLNMALCEALYTPLGFLEISLRNSLHSSLSDLYGTSSWFLLPGLLEHEDARSVARVVRRIEGQGKHSTSDRIVSELNFGFWVSLLSAPYDAKFWRLNKAHALKRTFPRIPRHLRQRQTIYKRYNQIRVLRNRVFHHETIWNRITLDKDHEDIVEAIGWVSPEMAAACSLANRFPLVRDQGYSEIERTVVAFLRT